MSRYIAQVTRLSVTGLPKDEAENVFHFNSATAGAGTVGEGTSIVTALASFYNISHTAASGGTPLAGYLSPAWSETTTVKVYDEDDATRPRPILHQGNFAMAEATANPLPENVALCMSYRSTANAPRHRGRIYLGPLAASAMDAPGVTQDAPLVESRPSTYFQYALAGAGSFLRGADYDTHVAAPLAGGIVWCVRSGLGTGTWSNKTKTGTKVITYEPVQAGWVDNEWDTQRRRRIAASSRLPF